jgi:hypothetical protein
LTAHIKKQKSQGLQSHNTFIYHKTVWHILSKSESLWLFLGELGYRTGRGHQKHIHASWELALIIINDYNGDGGNGGADEMRVFHM